MALQLVSEGPWGPEQWPGEEGGRPESLGFLCRRRQLLCSAVIVLGLVAVLHTHLTLVLLAPCYMCVPAPHWKQFLCKSHMASMSGETGSRGLLCWRPTCTQST